MGSGGISAVCDTGPLLHLAEIDRLSLMCLFENLHVPEGVWLEASEGDRVMRYRLEKLKNIRRHNLSQTDLQLFIQRQGNLYSTQQVVSFGGDTLMGEILNAHTERKIIKKLRMLPPQQLDEVLQFIDSIVERCGSSTDVSKSADLERSILALRGRGKGERLTERLLQSRREDQRRNERK